MLYNYTLIFQIQEQNQWKFLDFILYNIERICGCRTFVSKYIWGRNEQYILKGNVKRQPTQKKRLNVLKVQYQMFFYERSF